ncbi:uncharacterized protein LOC111642714 [Centruroides sculpturatus]|uniref:uncharacterized protein LOC111642714 n=1 Tax=Centruroides sculpturatus TaxID=218467 RepID=UPI000C6D34D6|nr:uncharacterized protein LOC111642714 [Centruroides sculpturatus]
MINIYKSTKKPVNTEITAISSKLDQLLEASKAAPPIPTYAAVAKAGPTVSRTSGNGAVILIESNDTSETAATIKRRIKQHLNPKQLKIGISKVRKVRNNTLLVELEKQGNGKKLIEEIQKIHNLKETLVEAIHQQNTKIAEQYNNYEEFKKQIQVRYKWGKKPEVNHWVCEVTPQLKKLMTKQKKLYIDWVRCNVKEYFNIVQCYRCCKYGHYAKECSSERAYCNHCGGDHRYSECKNKSTSPSCINCIRNKASNFAHRANQKIPAQNESKS